MSDRPTTDDLYRGSLGPPTSGSSTPGGSGGASTSGGSTSSGSFPSLPGGPPAPARTPPAPAYAPRPTESAAGGSTTTKARSKSPGQLVKEISEDFSSLIRKEIDLAKQELGASAAVKAKGAAIVAVGALFGLFALIFLLLGLRDGLDEFLWTWLADIVTALILLVIGGIAVLVARKKLATPISAELTKQTVKEDIEWAKTLGKR